MSTGAVHKVRTCSSVRTCLSVHWSCTQGEDVFKCPLDLYIGRGRVQVSTGVVHKVRTCSSVHWSCTQGEDVFKCPLELYTG